MLVKLKRSFSFRKNNSTQNLNSSDSSCISNQTIYENSTVKVSTSQSVRYPRAADIHRGTTTPPPQPTNQGSDGIVKRKGKGIGRSQSLRNNVDYNTSPYYYKSTQPVKQSHFSSSTSSIAESNTSSTSLFSSFKKYKKHHKQQTPPSSKMSSSSSNQVNTPTSDGPARPPAGYTRQRSFSRPINTLPGVTTPGQGDSTPQTKTSSSRNSSIPRNTSHSNISSNGTGVPEQELREIHERMSKKITQLTKVVYNLNTKNDEHAETIRKLKTNHKNELAGLATEMESKLTKLKEKASTEIAVKERVKTLEQEVDSLAKTKSSYEEKMSEAKRAAEAQLDKKLRDHDSELQTLNSQLNEVISRAQSATSDTEKTKSKYTKKIMELEAELIKYDAVDKELKLSKHEVHELETRIISLQAQFDKEIKTKQDTYETQLATLHADHSSELKKLLDEKLEFEQKFKESFDELERNQESHLAEVTKNSDEILRKSFLLEKENESYQHQVKQAQMNYDKTLNDLQQKHAKEFAQIKLELEKSIQEQQTATSLLKSLETKNSDISKNVQIRELQIQDLHAKLSQMNCQISESDSSRTQVVKDLESRLAESLTDLDIQASSHTKALQEIDYHHLENIKKLMIDHETAIGVLKIEHSEELTNLKRIFESEKKAAKTENAKSVGQLESEMAEKISILQANEQKALEEHTRLEGLINQYQTQIQDYEKQLSSLTAKNSNLLNLSDLKDDEGKRQALEVELLEKRLEELEDEQNALEAEKRAELEQLRLSHDADIALFKTDLARNYEIELQEKLEKLRHNLEQRFALERQNIVESTSESLEEKHAKEKDLWLRQLESVGKQYQELASEKTEGEDKLTEKYNSQRDSLQQQIAELTTQILQEQEQHKAKMIAMETTQQTILEETKEKLKREHNILIDNLKASSEQALIDREHEVLSTKSLQFESLRSNLESEKNEALANAKQDYEDQIAQAKQEMERYQSTAFNQLQQRFKHELAQVRDQAISERECALKRENTLAEQLAILKENLSDSKNTTTRLNQKVNALEENLQYARRQMSNVEKDRENVRLQLLAEVQKQREGLEEEHKETMVKLEQEWKEKKGNMIHEFENIKNDLNTKILDQESQIKSWRERWSARGPRKEDQVRMQDLSNTIKDKDTTIGRLVDEKRFYQLELANRDQNFNKVFANNNTSRVQSPLIGILDPVSGQTIVNDRYGANFTRMDFQNNNNMHAIGSLKENGNGGGGVLPPRRLDPIANPGSVGSNAPVKKFVRS